MSWYLGRSQKAAEGQLREQRPQSEAKACSRQDRLRACDGWPGGRWAACLPNPTTLQPLRHHHRLPHTRRVMLKGVMSLKVRASGSMAHVGANLPVLRHQALESAMGTASGIGQVRSPTFPAWPEALSPPFALSQSPGRFLQRMLQSDLIPESGTRFMGSRNIAV